MSPEFAKMLGPIIVFLIVYAVIATEKIEKSVISIIGAVAVLALGYISFHDAMQSIDLNVIFLLVGMMGAVSILAETGFFQWLAIYSAKHSRGNIYLITTLLLLITMLLSAFLDNVTTVILTVPITILVCRLLEIPVAPLIILEAMASNIGGTATLIGDPPNIVIGSQAGLTFNDFLFHLAPCVIVIGAVFVTIALCIISMHRNISPSVRARVIHSYPELAITDRKKMWRSLAVFALIFAGFFMHSMIGLEPGIIALGGFALMLSVCKTKSDAVLKHVEWDVILFFIGLFIIIGALEANGVIGFLAGKIISISSGNMLLACMIILWGSALFSAILDNIPFVIAMTPLVQEMLRSMQMPDHGVNPLFWALALGACLGGNGTLIGASANVVSCKLAEKNGIHISFMRFLRWGIPLTFVQVFLAMCYMYFRYF